MQAVKVFTFRCKGLSGKVEEEPLLREEKTGEIEFELQFTNLSPVHDEANVKK